MQEIHHDHKLRRWKNSFFARWFSSFKVYYKEPNSTRQAFTRLTVQLLNNRHEQFYRVFKVPALNN